MQASENLDFSVQSASRIGLKYVGLLSHRCSGGVFKLAE